MRKILKLLIWIIVLAGLATLAELFFLQKIINRPTPETQSKLGQAVEDASSNITEPNNQAPDSTDQIALDGANKQTSDTETASSNNLPAKSLINIHFYSQAPLGQWDAFHEDMCEEASVLNAALYLQDKKISNEDFEDRLQEMQEAEKKEIGEWKSTTIAQTKQFSDSYFAGKIRSKIVDNPSIENIEVEVAAGHPVVVPLAGRDIGNPNFTPPGPIYHMLVVKGYDATNFITNDVGTRKGNSYTYKKEVIMKNMHDWNAKDIHLGGKRVLVLYKND